MTLSKIVILVCSVLFLMIGIDKFIPYMEPQCSLTQNIHPFIWRTLGALQIAASFLIWKIKYRNFIAGLFIVFMLFFISYHLAVYTHDIGGAVFMTILLGLLLWNPGFINRPLLS